MVPNTRKLQTEQSNPERTIYRYVSTNQTSSIYLSPFSGSLKKNKSPHITIISCASQSNEFEPFSTATDKSQGLPVRPTEIEDINNKSQTELHTRTGQIIPHTSILGSGCSNEQFSVKTKGKEINGRKVYLHHNITY